jgi:hypothetical protein
MSTTVQSSSGIGFFGLLAIVFITLKLCGVITWSWWWVLAPLWGPLLLLLVVIAAILCVALLVAIVSAFR